MNQRVKFISEREMSTKMNAYNKENGTDYCFIWNANYCYLRDMNSSVRLDEQETIDFILVLLGDINSLPAVMENMTLYHDMFRKVYILYWEELEDEWT